MTFSQRNRIPVIASVFIIAASLTLTGCASEGDAPPADDIIVIDEAQHGDDNANDQDADGFSTNWAALPKDWPAGIPLLSEKVSDSNYGKTPDGESWRVEILADDLSTDLATARDMMNAGDFTEESWGESDDGPQGVFVSDTHRVVVTGTPGVYGEDVVRYEVTPL